MRKTKAVISDAKKAVERAFLGLMLKAEKSEIERYRRAGVVLDADDFTSERRKFIFDFCASEIKAGRAPNPVLMLSKAGDQEAAINQEMFLCAQTAAQDHVSGLDGLASDLKAASVRRHWAADLERLQDDLKSDEDPEVLLEKAQEKITAYRQSMSGAASGLCVSVLAFDSFVKEAKAVKDGITDRGLATGFPVFDAATGGLRKKTLNILAARPGVGKSALALNIVVNALRRTKDAPVLVFSLEMPREDLAARICAILSSADMARLEDLDLTAEQWDAVFNFFGHEGTRLFFDDAPALKPSDIDAVLARMKARRGTPALVVVDYLQLMQSDSKAENNVIRVGQISRDLKILSGRYDCPFLVLSQMNRASLKNEGGPQNSDLRDSGAIEQDADTITFLNNGKEASEMWMSITKNRRGGLRAGDQKIRLYFDHAKQTITERGDLPVYGGGNDGNGR